MAGPGEGRAAPPQKSHSATWKTEIVWKDLCCDERVLPFVISSVFIMSSLQRPPPIRKVSVVKEIPLKTQAKGGTLPSLMKASGEHIEVLGPFARVSEVTTYVITAKSPEPQTEMLAADLARRWAKLGLEF